MQIAIPTVQGTPGRTLNLKGTFAYVADDGNLTLQDANTGVKRVLIKTGPTGYAQFPAFSPDGKQVAYTFSSFTKDGQVLSEIHIINVDGTDERTVLAPPDIKTVYDLPAWSPDAKTLYVTTTKAVPPSNQTIELDRVNVDGSGLTKIIDNGSNASVSPDNTKIVYQLLDYAKYTAALWIANIDGSNARQLVDGNTFSAMFGPRFSPDGKSIVFAESGVPKKQLPGVQGRVAQPPVAAAVSPLRLASIFARWLGRPAMHGYPWDLFLVNPDGTKFDRLTQLGADSPVPVWSQDGKAIAFFEATGIYLLDMTNKQLYPVSTPGGYGGFDWH